MLCCWICGCSLCQEGSRCPWRGARLQTTSENPAQQNYDTRNKNDVKAKKSLIFGFNQLVDRIWEPGSIYRSNTANSVINRCTVALYICWKQGHIENLLDYLYINRIFLTFFPKNALWAVLETSRCPCLSWYFGLYVSIYWIDLLHTVALKSFHALWKHLSCTAQSDSLSFSPSFSLYHLAR